MASTDDSALDPEAAGRIAEAFVAARRTHGRLAEFPGPMPIDLAAAYAIQDRAILLRGGSVAGWKVGRIHPPASLVFGADRLAGPIFADQTFLLGDCLPTMPILAAGFAAAEAELLIRVGTPPADGRGMTPADARHHVESIHVGIEIASSPFPGINDHGPAVTVSDFGNNFGLLVGPAIDGWADFGFEDWRVSASIDGHLVGEGQASAMPDGVLGAAAFLFDNLARRGHPIHPGMWISTGAITGVHPIRPGQSFEADFGGRLPVSCRVEAA